MFGWTRQESGGPDAEENSVFLKPCLSKTLFQEKMSKSDPNIADTDADVRAKKGCSLASTPPCH